MEIELKEALAIVLELAEGNALNVEDCREAELLEEALKQVAAIETVRTHLEAQ
jgi:hypothetical protein